MLLLLKMLTKSCLILMLISTTWAGVLPKSRRPLRHGTRYGYILGQIELRDPSLEIDNFALRKNIHPTDENLFGKDGIIYLSRPRVKNNLLNKVAEMMALQYLRLREPEYQDSRSDEELGLRYRRVDSKPQLVYEFNELVV